MLKITRAIGLLTALGTLSLYSILAFFNPYTTGVTLTLPIALMMVTATVGAAAAYLARPYLMLAIGLIALVPLGLYMLGIPGLFRWIGIFDLLYLAAAIAVWIEKRATKIPQKPTTP